MKTNPIGYRPFVLSLLSLSLLAMLAAQAQASCTLTSTAGDDVNTCDSGSSGAFTDLLGNNSLTFPVLGTGSVQGPVRFGPGNDQFTLNAGSVVGPLSMGDGANSVTVNGGTVSGALTQGSGIDNFIMNGGTIASLAQGDGRDTFLMTAGTITGAFEDGDVAKMTGGSIGRVDMKLDNNIYTMSGGRIIGNLVTGFGNDTIILSGGSIGGNISVSGGTDSITVTGGDVGGEIRASFGNDTFRWSNGGTLHSAVLMGEDNDSAILSQLTEAVMAPTPLLDGGPGVDTLTFDAVTTSVPARYSNWETVNLNNGSHLDLAGTLTLGDATTGTGVLNIDPSSTVASLTGTVSPFVSGQAVTVNNAGTLDMTTASNSATDTLRINGNYVGNGGQLLLQSQLGNDASPSDKLVVSQGTITGTTQMTVTNLGGSGAATLQNGIQVVEALNGATSANSAFTLKNSLSVGAYQYYLFKGGATAGSENSWFLRSAVISPALTTTAVTPQPPATPVVPVVPPTAPAPPVTPGAPVAPSPPATVQPAASLPVAAVGTPPLPAAAPGAAPITLYRMEVPNYAVVAPAAALLAQTTLGTFHDRQGDQALLKENGWAPAGWARTFGSNFKRSWSGTVEPTLDASLVGYQIGHDLYASTSDSGWAQHAGLFVGHTRLDGHVDGFAGGFHDQRTGKLKLEGDSLGAYWTLINPKGWYIDAVAMGTRLDGYSRSDRGVRIDTRGHVLSLSLETGYPIRLSPNWVIEPQAQLISQRVRLDGQDDGISHVAFDSQAFNTARLGARLKGHYVVQGMPLEPYIRTNLWRNFGGASTVTFDHVTKVNTEIKSTTLDLGVGLIAQVSKDVSVYVSADYSSNVDDNDLNGVIGNLGVRMSW